MPHSACSSSLFPVRGFEVPAISKDLPLHDSGQAGLSVNVRKRWPRPGGKRAHDCNDTTKLLAFSPISVFLTLLPRMVRSKKSSVQTSLSAHVVHKPASPRSVARKYCEPCTIFILFGQPALEDLHWSYSGFKFDSHGSGKRRWKLPCSHNQYS
jgi:hypothetical protein